MTLEECAALDFETLVEVLSSKLHAIYQQEARRQGDVRHHDDYSQLAEHTKEYDRVLAHFIIKHAPFETWHAMACDPLDNTRWQDIAAQAIQARRTP